MLTPNNDSAPACDRSAMLIAAREEGKMVETSQGRRAKGPQSDASAPAGSETAPRMAVWFSGSLISSFITWTPWGFPHTQQLLPLTHSSHCHRTRSPVVLDREILVALALPVPVSTSAWGVVVNSVSPSTDWNAGYVVCEVVKGVLCHSWVNSVVTGL